MWGGGFNSFICKLVIGSRRRRRRRTDIIYIGTGSDGGKRVFAGRSKERERERDIERERQREGVRDGQTMTECQRD